MTYAPAKFEVATSSGLGGYAFTKNTLFDLDPTPRLWGQGHMKCCQCPLHHVIFAPEKFEVATCESFGRDVFTRNVTESHISTCNHIVGQTDFGIKLVLPLSKEKSWYKYNL